MIRPLPIIVGVLIALSLGVTTTASAEVCGTVPEGTNEPLEGTLELEEKRSDLNVDFEQGGGEKRVLLIFDVSNCTVGPDEAVQVKARSADLPSATFGETDSETDRRVVEVEVPVYADAFDPGKYEASVRVSGTNLAPSVQGVVVQRSESWFLPTVIALFFMAAGFVGAVLARRFDSGGWPSGKRFLLAAVPVLVAAGAVWKTGYLDAEVWVADAGSIVTLIIGVTPAAFGAALGSFVTKAQG